MSGLVLASTPAASWKPDERVNRCTQAPWLSAPAFFLGATERLWTEIAGALPDAAERFTRLAGYIREISLHPASPAAMARRVRALEGCDFVANARALAAPTLVMTGEERLDRVVPVSGTREYLTLITGATLVTLRGTGHIGLVTKPREFAQAIADFVSRQEELNGEITRLTTR